MKQKAKDTAREAYLAGVSISELQKKIESPAPIVRSALTTADANPKITKRLVIKLPVEVLAAAVTPGGLAGGTAA